MKNSSYLARWTKPYFMDTKWIVGFDGEHSNNRAVSNNFDILSTALKMHATYELNDFLRYGWSYRLQRSSTKLSSSVDTKSEQAEASKAGTVSAFGPRLTYDSTNRLYNPTNGLRSELSFEYSGLGGDYNFYSCA
jgi:outer membrane protein insertion porin family